MSSGQGQVQAYYIAQPAVGQAVSTLQYPQQNQRAVVAYAQPQPQAVAYAQPQAVAYAQPQAQQAYTTMQAQPQAYTTTAAAPAGQPQIVYATQQTQGGQQVLAVQPQQLQAVSLQQQQPAQTGFLGADPPEWLKERSEAGPFAASPLVWTALVALLIALILHVVAMSLALWSTTANLSQGIIAVYLGLFQYCVSGTCHNVYDFFNGTVLRAEQAMAILALIIMVICIIIFFIFISRKTNRKPMQMVTIIGSVLAAIILLIIVAVWEAYMRRTLSTFAVIGPAFIIEIVALVVQLLGAGLLIGHYAAITSRL